MEGRVRSEPRRQRCGTGSVSAAFASRASTTSATKRKPRPCTVRMIVCAVAIIAHAPGGPTGRGWRCWHPTRCRPCQIVFGDLVLRHHAVAVADEMDQQRKHLRLQPHRVAVAAQFEALGVEPEVAKSPRHATEYRKIAESCTKSSDTDQARPGRAPSLDGQRGIAACADNPATRSTTMDAQDHTHNERPRPAVRQHSRHGRRHARHPDQQPRARGRADLRQGRVLQPGRLGQGPAGAQHHRGGRALRRAEARADRGRGDERQHRHRTGHGLRPEGLSAGRDDGRQLLGRAAAADAHAGRQGGADARARRRAPACT